MRLTVLYDNTTLRDDLVPDWGFSCAIELSGTRVLFDTGADPEILLGNMARLGFEPGSFEYVMISHDHWDHTGGLDAVLDTNPDATVVIPSGFSVDFRHGVRAHGAGVIEIDCAGPVALGLDSTGRVPGAIAEQAAVVHVRNGVVATTGCAHPGVVDMVTQARAVAERDVELVLGGFHLNGRDESTVADVIERLQRLGVRRAAPCHCTGAEAIELFAEAWCGDFVRVGVGWSETWDDADTENTGH